MHRRHPGGIHNWGIQMKKTTFFIAMAAVLGFQATAIAEPTLAIGGVVEVEASSGEDTSDITLATVEVALAAQINEKVAAEVVLLHEEDETDFSVDTATVSLAFSDSLGVTAGQTYIPFGVFASHMIADPLPLELAETGATALQVDYTAGPLLASLYTFNGVNAEEEIDNWGVNLAWANDNLALALGYLANIGDTDAIAAETIDRKVPGMSISAGASAGGFSLIGEYLTARDAFQAGDGSFTTRAKPSAANLELSYTMGATTLAVGMQNTKEAEELGLAERRTLATIANEFAENTVVALEWRNDEDYAGERSTTVTAQLAVAF